MKKSILLAGAAASLMLAAALPAAAQSVDYGSLQSIFNEAVTTSATGSPQRSTEAPADMQIISADDIRKSGEVTLPGILQRVAGVDVLNESAGQSDVNVRGYDQTSSPRLLVLINGRQVYQDHYGETQWATLPVQLDEIRQIEVVKGPNAALFGFNAVSGVINIITYNPKYDDVSVATARVGLNNERQISLVETLKLGPAVSVRLSGGGQGINEWNTTGTGLAANTLHNPVSSEGNMDTVVQLAPKTELRVEGSWNNSIEDQDVGSAVDVVKTVSTSGKVTLASDTDYGLMQASAYSNQLQIKYPFGDFYNVIDVANLQDLFKVGANNTFRISGEFRHNSLNTASIGGGNVSYNVLSAAGMWNWVITSQLTTTAAVRVDSLTLSRTGDFPAGIPLANNAFWNRTITEPSVNLTGAWRPTDTDTVKLSYARGIQAPSLIELGGLQFALVEGPHFVLNIMGNPNLQPTIAQNYEASYDHDFKAAKVGVRVFYQTWTQLKSGINTAGGLNIYPTMTTNGAFTYENVSNSKETGVELSASGKFSNALTWHGDYTYTDVKDSPFVGQDAVANTVAFQQTTPKFRGNIGLDWDPGQWETDVNLHYVGAFQFYGLAGAATPGALSPIKAYQSLSARVGYRFAYGFTVALSGQNLLTSEQNQTAGLLAQREAQLTVSKAW